jgi:hypothetical protein
MDIRVLRRREVADRQDAIALDADVGAPDAGLLTMPS